VLKLSSVVLLGMYNPLSSATPDRTISLKESVDLLPRVEWYVITCLEIDSDCRCYRTNTIEICNTVY
jgi:hypothetical protein